MKRTIAKIVIVVGLVLALIFAVAFTAAGYEDVGLVILIVYLAVLIVCSFSLRCQSCGMHLDRSTLWAKYCPHCGEKLDD